MDVGPVEIGPVEIGPVEIGSAEPTGIVDRATSPLSLDALHRRIEAGERFGFLQF